MTRPKRTQKDVSCETSRDEGPLDLAAFEPARREISASFHGLLAHFVEEHGLPEALAAALIQCEMCQWIGRSIGQNADPSFYGKTIAVIDSARDIAKALSLRGAGEVRH